MRWLPALALLVALLALAAHRGDAAAVAQPPPGAGGGAPAEPPQPVMPASRQQPRADASSKARKSKTGERRGAKAEKDAAAAAAADAPNPPSSQPPQSDVPAAAGGAGGVPADADAAAAAASGEGVAWGKVLGVLVALAAGGYGAYAYLSTRTGLPSVPIGNSILLLGDVGSGKTTLFFWLRDGEASETVTSMRENNEEFVPRGLPAGADAKRRWVDFPGHGSQRYRLGEFLGAARAVVFLVDAASTDLQAAGELLFAVLSARELVRRRTPLLLAAAKADAPGARSPAALADELLRVVNLKRRLQHNMADLDGAAEGPVTLGEEGRPFAFEQHPCPVELGAISTVEGRVEDLARFLAKLK